MLPRFRLTKKDEAQRLPPLGFGEASALNSPKFQGIFVCYVVTLALSTYSRSPVYPTPLNNPPNTMYYVTLGF